MFTRLFTLLPSVALLAISATATSITFSGPSSVAPGASFNVDVDISGVIVPPGIAAYLVTVNYDDTDLILADAVEGSYLQSGGNFYTNPAAAGQAQASDVLNSGGTSTSSGTLFTFTFSQAAKPAASSFTFSFIPYSAPGLNLEIADPTLNDITVDASNTLTVNVLPGSSAVPEPSTLTFLGVAMLHSCWCVESTPQRFTSDSRLPGGGFCCSWRFGFAVIRRG